MYTKETEWKLLVSLLQEKISGVNSTKETRFYFEQTMTGMIAIIFLFQSLIL